MKKRVIFKTLKKGCIAAGGIGLIALGVVGVISNETSATDGSLHLSMTKSKMTTLTLSKVFTAEEASGINSVQSFAVTDKYFVAIHTDVTNENLAYVRAYNLKDHKLAWSKKSTILGHGNGATWNRNTDEIVVVNGKKRVFFNAKTGAYKTTKTVSSSATGIAYDFISNLYVQTSGYSDASGSLYSADFSTRKLKFDASHPLVNQDVGYNNGYIYRVAWMGCSYLSGKTVNGVDLGSNCTKNWTSGANALYQFDTDGNLIDAFYIPKGYGELESVDFGTDGTPYLQFNGSPDKNHFTVYKVTNKAALDKMKRKYKISFNANGGSNAPKAISEYIGTATTIPTSTPTRSGYSFVGWNTTKTATSAKYKAGAKFNGQIEKDMTLYAIWKKDAEAEKSFTISFNANGGTGAPSSIVGTASKGVKIPTATPTREKYEFIGWSTSKTATAADSSYAPGKTVKPSANITLYAIWEKEDEPVADPEPEKNITVSFDANGGTGAPKAITAAISSGVKIPQTTPTRANYKFLGWNTDKNATSADSTYARGTTIKPTKNITLYAIWQINTRRLSFDANGGTASVEYIDKAYNETIDYSKVTAQRTGYKFVGWAKTVDIKGYNEIFTSDSKYTDTDDQTLHAIWQKNIRIELVDNVTSDDGKEPSKDGDDAGDNLADTTYTGDQIIDLVYIENISEQIVEARQSGEELTGAAKTYAANYLKARKSLVISELEQPKSPDQTFIGWTTVEGSNTVEYAPDSEEIIKDSVKLYPVWIDDDSGRDYRYYDSDDDTCDLNVPEGEDSSVICGNGVSNPKTADELVKYLPYALGSLGIFTVLVAILKRRR